MSDTVKKAAAVVSIAATIASTAISPNQNLAKDYKNYDRIRREREERQYESQREAERRNHLEKQGKRK